MNNVTPYEILIAEKVEQLAVPDMADSIWASIEQQLDADTSPDDGDGSPGDNTPPTGLSGMGKGFVMFMAVATTVTSAILFTENKSVEPAKTLEQTTAPPAQRTILTRDSAGRIIEVPVQRNFTPSLPLPASGDSIASIIIDDSPFFPDSIGTTVNIPLAIPDTLTAKKDNTAASVADSTSVKPPPKKPGGVKGITPDDYKISSKNDSLKKG